MRRPTAASAIAGESEDADDSSAKAGRADEFSKAPCSEFGGDVGTWAIKFVLASPVVVIHIAGRDHLRPSAGAEPTSRSSADVPKEFVERAFAVYDDEDLSGHREDES